MQIKNFEEVAGLLKPMLSRYLESKGINTHSHFLCFNPEHQETQGSMSLYGEHRDNFHCFGCLQGGDIFSAAHLLEGKPISGPGFIDDNVLYLADLFDIEVEVKEPSEAELYRLQAYRAYADAAQLVNTFELTDKVKEEMERRGWTPELLQDQMVGCVPSFQDYWQQMQGRGWDTDFLDDIDLGRRGGKPNPIFSKDMLIFTVCDEHGRPCGFASRNLNFNPEEAGNKKYINTATVERCDIYRKSERLYGLHEAKKISGPLHIVEGYADRLTLFQHGIKDVVAIGGTAFTDRHVDTLRREGCRDLILALDGDKAGQNRTETLINKYLTGQKDMKIRVLTIPDGLDPDDYVRSNGPEAWSSLTPDSAFAWRLNRFTDRADMVDVCTAMIPIIATEVSNIEREIMCKSLARFTGFSIASIEGELARLMDTKESDRLRKKEVVIEQALRAARRDPDRATELLIKAAEDAQQIDQDYGKDNYSSMECCSALSVQANFELNKVAEREGWLLGPDLADLEGGFESPDLRGAWVGLGGSGNVGKTNLCCNLAVSIAQYNPNALVIYHTIDDIRPKITTRMALTVLGDDAGGVKLNWLKHPNFYLQYDPQLLEKHKLAYRRLERLMTEERLVVKDMMLGTGLGTMNNLLNYYRKRHPEKDIIFIVDNFHLLDRKGNSEKDNDKLSETAMEFKRTLARYGATGISTLEYTKLQPSERPSNKDIYGSVQFEYELDVIIHLYNELHGLKHRAQTVHIDADGKRLPTIELNFAKNKVGEFKEVKYLDMWPAQARFRSVSLETVQMRLNQGKEDHGQGQVIPGQDYFNYNGKRLPVL